MFCNLNDQWFARPAVVLATGGIKSSLILKHVARFHAKTIAFRINAGYSNVEEHFWLNEQVKDLATRFRFKVHKRLIDVADIWTNWNPDSFGMITPDKRKPGFRHVAVLAATIMAMQAGGGIIYAGFSDMGDNGQHELDIMHVMIRTMSHSRVYLMTPLASYSYSDIVAMALATNVSVGITWSCYYAGNQPCQNCSGCVARNEAFETVYGLGIKALPDVHIPWNLTPDIIQKSINILPSAQGV